MSNMTTCWYTACPDPPRWRMVGAGGFVVGLLCEHHKATEYEKKAHHKTTLHAIAPERNRDEMASHDPQDGVFGEREPAEPVTTGAGHGGGGGPGDRMEPGQRHRSLATSPQASPPSHPSGRSWTDSPLAVYTAEAGVRQFGTLALNAEVIASLGAPPDPLEVEIRPDGIVYAPWGAVANRLDAALGIGQWALVPEGGPQIQDGFVCWHFHLFVRGQWVATAIGEHPDPKWQKMSLANRAESAKSDALVKCSKALGVFREMWDKGFCTAWQEEYAERVWALQGERSSAGQWLWRRKDRRPFFKERPAKDQMDTEYHKRRDYEDDAREHLDAIARGDA